jgi:hypothetical protein
MLWVSENFSVVAREDLKRTILKKKDTHRKFHCEVAQGTRREPCSDVQLFKCDCKMRDIRLSTRGSRDLRTYGTVKRERPLLTKSEYKIIVK